MSDNYSTNPSGKLLFGVDYLNIMRNMEIPKEGETYDYEKRDIVDAVIRFFLLQWDFSVEEIDAANKLFWEKVNAKTLDENFITVIDRVVDFLKNDKKAQERFLTEMAAIGQLDSTVLNSELELFDHFQARFDFRPSEKTVMIKKGSDWAMALNFLGDRYIGFKNVGVEK